DETINFLVKKGQSTKEIANGLERAGLIRYEIAFRWYASVAKEGGKLKAGEYKLSSSMTIPEIITKMVSGDMIKRKITIIEGWTLKDIGEYLEKEKIASFEQLLEMDNIKKSEEGMGLEGYLFPDTYELSPEDGLEEIIKGMIENFDSKVNSELKEEILLQEKTLSEIIIMASLLEKEVRSIEDKKIVSGILWNRLELGMPLQVDSTITYITNKNTTAILKEELEIDSLYNTYKYKGLPVGPICNPGIESIKAAIYPIENDYLFYLSTPEGETIFSKTLKEHNIAINEYLR
ncbi:endolytic transglycosylase MltG, partial [Patescibacteria group bacterium]|nr:endolytic transglycosylase MltG [Patescibacteria group bacterium]